MTYQIMEIRNGIERPVLPIHDTTFDNPYDAATLVNELNHLNINGSVFIVRKRK